MSLTKFARCVLKRNPLAPSIYFNTTNLYRKISNEPLEKSNTSTEGNLATNLTNKADAQEDTSVKNDSVQRSLATEENLQVAEQEDISSVPHSLIQRKESSEIFLNADPFEEVPGPKILKKISSIWKYLPEFGYQTTVSTMLSYFNIAQRLTIAAKLERPNARPFDRLFQKYGPIVKLQGPLGADIVLICKPEHVAKVYDQEGKHPVRSTLDSVEKCRNNTRKHCGGPFNLNGIEWEEMRKALKEPLKSGGEKYFDAIENAADMFTKRIRGIRNRQNEVPVDFMVEVTKWSMECLCYVTLGKSLGFHSMEINTNSEPLKLLNAILTATSNICKCESGFQLWRFMNTPSSIALSQACETIDTHISKYIRIAQVNLTKNKDEMLKNENSLTSLPFIENLLLNECMSPDEVLTCIVDILLLGVNATSISLAFTLYHLAQNQRAQRILFKEVKEALPEKNSRLEYKQLSPLKYLDACLNESLRLRMPMPTLTRVLPSDIVLSNFRIPKGTYMVMDVQATCLKEQNFEKFDKFLPERWFDPSNIHPFSFLPFGHGLRSCIGKHLAEVQLKTCIAKIVRFFQIEYNYGEIQGTKTVISFPNKPLKLTFTEREE